MAFECLEDRTLLTAVPFGAVPDDTAEFMLGDVLVTVVLMESSENISLINPNSEDWTDPAIEVVKQRVTEGMTWWEDTLGEMYPNAPHSLNFHYDFTYADNPVETRYEPIANISNEFDSWIYDFLNLVDYGSTGNFSSDIYAFNHSQREAYGTDWAFTVFVVNDENDSDGEFASGGSFARAFAFPGGQFFITPAGRPASTYAHESGHIFWARDEYLGAGSYTDRRGYYNAQNWNAWDNPAFQQPDVDQADSIMANGTYLLDAYGAYTSSQPSLEMIGWRDSDGDGIFDVLDVPLTLTGSGSVDTETDEYRFVGSSSVQTLVNENSSGQQNDITINEISRAEYRIDPVNPGGEWMALVAGVSGTYVADLDLRIPLPDANPHVIEIRTIDDDSGVTSPIFQGDTTTATSFLQQGINGFVWNDIDDNTQIDPGEPGLSGWTVRLVDAEGEPSAVDAVEPDDHASFTRLDSVNSKVTLTTVGVSVDGSVYARNGNPSSTGSKVFNYFHDDTGWGGAWTPESRNLRMDFATPVSAISLDAVGNSSSDYGRLEVYDGAGILLARYTTGQLGFGEVEAMTVGRSTPDIAHAIARGHMGSDINLDNLRFGPEIETLTNGAGAFSLSNLPAGTYYVEAVAPGSPDPLTQQHEITLAEGEAAGDVNFDGQAASWRNPATPTDVNDDGIVSPLDALLVISYINAHPQDPSVPPSPAEPPPYYDVDGNGIVSALDVLTVVSKLNAQAAGGPESEPADVPRGPGEGESTPSKPLVPTPFLAAAMPATPLPPSESLSSPTTPYQERATNHRDLWRTAADDYFRQCNSPGRESSVAVRQINELDGDLDQILPEIALDIAILSEGVVIV